MVKSNQLVQNDILVKLDMGAKKHRRGFFGSKFIVEKPMISYNAHSHIHLPKPRTISLVRF
jgi:hypothetical protein